MICVSGVGREELYSGKRVVDSAEDAPYGYSHESKP